VIGKGGICGGEFSGSCRVYVKVYFLSIILLPPRYAQGKELALAASAIGLGIAWGRNVRSKVPGAAQRPITNGKLLSSTVTSQGQTSGAGIVIPESVSLGPRLIPNKRGHNDLCASFIQLVLSMYPSHPKTREYETLGT
jgi:hypothetical protein